MYGMVPMVCENPQRFKPQEIFTYEGDYLGIAVNFFLPLDRHESLRVEIGNHGNDADQGAFDTDFFAFATSVQAVFEAYLTHHRHDGHWYAPGDCCQDYHQAWARWLRAYADRLERHCLPYAWRLRREG